jgi:IS30 family transposase
VKRLDEDRRIRAEAWLEKGLSPSMIARELGCSTRTVQRIARKLYEREDAYDQDIAAGTNHEKARAAVTPRGWADFALICGLGAFLVVSICTLSESRARTKSPRQQPY